MNEEAALLLKQIFTISREGKNALTIQEIQKSLIDSSKDKNEISIKTISSYLGLFLTEVSKPIIVRKSNRGDSVYSFDVAHVRSFERLQAIRSFISTLYGPHSLRVFNVCYDKKMIEAKQLTELTLLPPKDCKELTHLLVKEGFLQVQEVPKNSDRFPSETFFLYTIKPNEVISEFGNRLCDSLLHVREFRRNLDEKITSEEDAKVYYLFNCLL